MEVLLKIKNATPGNIKIKLNKALKRLGTDFHIEKCIKIRKSEKGRKLQGRINFQGLNISIENRKGSIRYGIDSDGHSWKTKMNYPYGRIIGVQRLGHDGDHIDCYVGDNRQSDKVYIIHIKNCVTGKYDEDKIMLGFNNQKEVITAFKTQYDNFSKIFDGIEKMSIYEFKECLKKKTKSIIVKLKDFTHENADYKVIKALAGVGKALNCDFICKSINHAEKPSYQALQDIIDNSNAEVEKIKRQAYNFLCKFLGLPKINKISKSINDELTVNGKVIFDPLYGKPLKQKDFVQMINRLENFLSRRLAESERRLLLQSTALGHLIALSQNGQTQLLLETVKLKNIVHKGKSFEQLCTDYETLKHNFDKVTDNEIAKLQFIEDKIGVYVTSAKNATIKIIKDIYYDAIINHKSKQKISQEMYDQLGFLNRSWDTIARTESNNLKNHAFIVGSLNDKGKTYFRRRVGSYNTCKICASHRDKIALWSEKPLTDDTINDELAEIAIWSGKSNIGRNQKDWWIPEGSTHPNCFCEWEKLLDEEVKYFRKSFTESDHPRAENGRFIEKTDISTPNNEAICQTLKNNIAPMPIEIPFTRENYDNLFKNGIDTPIGKVKLGENQYDKLKDKDLGSRQKILAPMYETLKNPALIIETKDNAKLFCKEFRKPDGSDKLMVSVVIDRNNLLISISTHIERLSQVQKKCRTILYKKNPNGNVGYTHHNDMSRNSSISKPINKSINHAEKPSYQALQDIIDNSNR